MKNPITEDLDQQLVNELPKAAVGQIASMASKYDLLSSKQLFGLLLEFDFAASTIITCDPWKRACGGAPRGGFILLKLDTQAISQEELEYANRLIIARIVDEAPTPVDTTTQQMLFQVHKLGALLVILRQVESGGCKRV